MQAVAAAVLLAAPLPARAQLAPNARPTGGQVVAGSASIGQTTTTTTIQQSSQRAAVNWQGYNVGSQQTVQYQQPNASAVTLNTVVGPNPSEIAGKIQANGQVVIVNQAGLVFDKGSQVNAAGLVVSAAGITTSNFMAGKMVFDQTANAGAKIENRGTITVNDEGLAALVAPQVRNAGKIQAKMGTVILAGAEAETLDLYGDGLVSINVTKQVTSAPDGTKALVTNSGVIAAQGGTVVLTADAVDGVVQTLVDAGGHISANSTAARTGRVLISGAGGDVTVEGTVSAQGFANGTTGGEVKVSGSAATIIGAHARISVSGKAGGGTIALGTTLKRAKDTGATGTAAAKTATLVLSKGSTITADATASGNGGRVVALASGTTTMAGTITAKGGKQGGNGGYVEVSGGTVVPTGHVDTTAPKGATGMLVFDPTDVWISDTQPTGTTPEVSWFSPTYLESQNSNVGLGASGNLNVASSFGTGNTLNLGSYTLALVGGTGLTIDRGFTIDASSIILSTSVGGGGAITLNGASGVTGGIITAQQLAALSPTAIGVTAGQNISMSGDGGIVLGAATIGSQGAPLGELDLYAAANGITQDPAGAIYATTLRGGTVVGDTSLIGTGNQIANLPYFSVTSGNFGLVDSSALSVTYVTGTNVFLQSSGGNALTVTTGGLVSTGSTSSGTVSLVADALTVPRTATIEGGTIEIAPSTAGVPVSVLPSSPPANTLTIDAELLGTLQTQTLRIGGYTDVPAGSDAVTPTSGSIDIASAFDLHGIATTLDLESLGPVTQEGPLTVHTLTGNAGVVTLTDPGNDVPDLGGFTAASFTLNDPDVSNALHVIGPVTASTVSLTAPSIRIDSGGIIQAATSTTLVATGGNQDCDCNSFVEGEGEGEGGGGSGGTILEGGVGVIDTALLTGSATGRVDLNGANDIAQLGAFSVGGSFLLNNQLNPLEIVGAFSGAGHSMTLYAGDITQSGDGVITARSLTGTATNVNLGTATGGNEIARLRDFTVTGGDFILVDGRALGVKGTVGADSIYLQTLNGTGLTLTPTAALNADPSIGVVTLVTDLLTTQMGAAITAPTVEIAPSTPGLAVSILPSSPPANTLTIDQAALSIIDTTTLRIGAFTDLPDGATTVGPPTASSIDIASPLNLTGVASILDLETTGAVTQEGNLVVNELTGRAGPLTLTTPGNAIAYLGAFTATGPFTLDDGSNALEIVGPFSGAGQTLTLNAGPITQSAAGGITAGTLTGTASFLNLTTATNAIDAIGPFTAGGDFLLGDSTGLLTVSGAISAGPSITLTNTGGLAIDAPIDPADTVTLIADGITQTAGGVITAGTLTGSAGAGGADLGAANLVTNLDTFTAADGFTLNDTASTLTVVGPVNGGTGVALTDSGSLVIGAPLTAGGTVALNAAGITQTGAGIITADELTGSAGSGGAALGTATNLVADLGTFSAGGAFSLLDGESLGVIGTVSAGPSATIAVGSGDLDQSAVVTAATVSETAAGNIFHAGNSIATAGNLTLTAGDAIVQSGGGGLGTIEATGGNVALIANGTATPYAITQGAGAQIVDPTSGGTISLTSATGIAFAGSIAAASPGNLDNPAGTVTLAAANGAITETAAGSHTGLLSALNLSGSATGGSVLLDAPSPTGTANQVVNLGQFSTAGTFTLIDGHTLTLNGNLTAGTAATVTVNGAGNNLTVAAGVTVAATTSAILMASNGNLGEAGTIAAPNIQLAAPLGTATASGSLNGVVSDPTLNPQMKLAAFPSNPSIGAWITGGNIVLGSGFAINGANGPAELVLAITNQNGIANLGTFNSPGTDLYLNLGLGRAAGTIAVNALQVQYASPGTSQVIDLLGTVNGHGGYAAAGVSFIYPHVNNNYQINGCPIGATSCFSLGVPVFVGIPTFLFPFINPLKDLDVEEPGEDDEILIILPDVGERDY